MCAGRGRAKKLAEYVVELDELERQLTGEMIALEKQKCNRGFGIGEVAGNRRRG